MKTYRYKKVVILLLLLYLMASGSSSADGETKLWSRGFDWTVNKETGAFRFMLFNVQQDEHEITAELVYDNYVLKGEDRQTMIIQGKRTSDGRFWPTVALAVKPNAEANWQPLEPCEVKGDKARISIEPWDVRKDLVVSLEPFKPYIGKCELGRLMLPSGDIAEFELNALKAPEENNGGR